MLAFTNMWRVLFADHAGDGGKLGRETAVFKSSDSVSNFFVVLVIAVGPNCNSFPKFLHKYLGTNSYWSEKTEWVIYLGSLAENFSFVIPLVLSPELTCCC